MDQTYLKGVTLALITAFISGFAVFINKFGVGFWESSSAYTTAKNMVAAILLTGLILFFYKLTELKQLPSKTWIKLALIGLVGGSIPFLLFFKSITMISAPEAAFIHKTIFLWIALFSYPFLKERLSSVQIIALCILFSGVFLFGAPSHLTFGVGFALALTATILWAIENVVAKITLRKVDPDIVPHLFWLDI